MYEIKEWNESIDLSDFYAEARKRGLHNNDSHESMIKPFEDLPNTTVLLLYYNNEVVGTAISHPFDEYEEGSYRIFARLCMFTDKTPLQRVGTIVEAFKYHQNTTSRFFLPEFAKRIDANMYFTTHPEDTGAMKMVHKVAAKAFAKYGDAKYMGQFDYRGRDQSVWKVNTEKWLSELDRYPIYDHLT